MPDEHWRELYELTALVRAGETLSPSEKRLLADLENEAEQQRRLEKVPQADAPSG